MISQSWGRSTDRNDLQNDVNNKSEQEATCLDITQAPACIHIRKSKDQTEKTDNSPDVSNKRPVRKLNGAESSQSSIKLRSFMLRGKSSVKKRPSEKKSSPLTSDLGQTAQFQRTKTVVRQRTNEAESNTQGGGDYAAVMKPPLKITKFQESGSSSPQKFNKVVFKKNR